MLTIYSCTSLTWILVFPLLSQAFAQLSGCKLNISKSELLLVNAPAVNGFTYLGIQVTRKFKDLYSANFSPLLRQIKEDLGRWRVLGLSLVAQINCIKMNILPRFSYIF